MKRIDIIVMVSIFLIVGCGSSGNQESSKEEAPKTLKSDKTTGLSRSAVNAQLKVGIHSPYQLIEATQESVEVILSENDFTSESLRNALNEKVFELMPQESDHVREEIVNYLVQYYIKNPI